MGAIARPTSQRSAERARERFGAQRNESFTGYRTGAAPRRRFRPWLTMQQSSGGNLASTVRHPQTFKKTRSSTSSGYPSGRSLDLLRSLARIKARTKSPTRTPEISMASPVVME